MRYKKPIFLAVVFLAPVIFPGAACLAQTQAEKTPYPAMARLDRYLAPDENSEIALARSGAPASKSWGADLPGSPVIASDDPEERATIFMVWVGKWSDGTPAPQATH